MEVSPSFRAFVARTFGDEGKAWLASLPELLRSLSEEWGLVLGEELRGGALSCVRAARSADGVEAVLKVARWPRPADEITALEAWNGRGAPRLLRHDHARGALLLERVRPGTIASGAVASEVGQLLGELHHEAPPMLPPLGSVVRCRLTQARAQGRASEAKVGWAVEKLEELEREMVRGVLLHGDFDTRNLLRCDRRGLVAIDPLPCVGDPAYDAGHWVHDNRRPGRRARLDAIVAATRLSRDRVRDWAAIVGVHG